jgi:hypothetical protein
MRALRRERVGIGRLARRLFVSLLVLGWCAVPAQASELDAASPEELIEVLKANVYLTGDIVKRMDAQTRLERLGRQDPAAVVPLVLAELAPPRSYGKIAAHQRLALIELLRDIGPAAEAAVPRLVEIMSDPEEPFESVQSQSAAALTRIGTADAKAAAKAYYAGLTTAFADTASDEEAVRSASQSAFLIRKELRSRAPSDGVIGASVDQLRALGQRASPAQPTLLRAYNDPRLSQDLRAEIATALQVTGVSDVPAAAAEAAARASIPDILAEVIEETRSEDDFVRGLAMGELGRLGPSKAAIDALIKAATRAMRRGCWATSGRLPRGPCPSWRAISTTKGPAPMPSRPPARLASRIQIPLPSCAASLPRPGTGTGAWRRQPSASCGLRKLFPNCSRHWPKAASTSASWRRRRWENWRARLRRLSRCWRRASRIPTST